MAPITWCLPFLCQFIRPPQFSVPVFGEHLQNAQNCHEAHNPSLSCTVCFCFSNTVEEPSAAAAPGASGSNAAAQSRDQTRERAFPCLCVCVCMHSRTEAGSLSYEQHGRSVVVLPSMNRSVSRPKWKDWSSLCLKKTPVAHLIENWLSHKIWLLWRHRLSVYSHRLPWPVFVVISFTVYCYGAVIYNLLLHFLFRSTCICVTTVLPTSRGTSSESSSLSPSMRLTPGSASCSSPTRSTTCTLTQSETAMKVSEQGNSTVARVLRLVGAVGPGSH